VLVSRYIVREQLAAESFNVVSAVVRHCHSLRRQITPLSPGPLPVYKLSSPVSLISIFE